MKITSVKLLDSVGPTYDKTRTTVGGRVFQKVLNLEPVLGAPLSTCIDVQTETSPGGAFLAGMMFLSPNGRLFALASAPAVGAAATNHIAMWTFNLSTGVHNYTGRIAFALAATGTVAMRGFKVDDSISSNIRAFLQFTITTASTGGLFLINKINIAHFVQSGFPTFYTAQANDIAAVYSLQAPAEIGGANLHTAGTGLVLPFMSANANINTKVFAHNGIAATHQYYVFDYSTGPTVAATQTVTSANTTGVSTTFTLNNHGYAINDAVVIPANAPTGYTVSPANAAQTIYYVVASNFTTNTFSLSATLGGAIVAASSAVANTTFTRAQGQSTNLFFVKTANLTALSGTLLLTNSENYCVPVAGDPNAGFDCVFLSTSTTFYLGKLEDLWSQLSGTTSSGNNLITGISSTAGLIVGQTVFGSGIPNGATISTIAGPTSITISVNATASATVTLTFGAILWSSLSPVNVLGTGIDYVAPIPINAAYMDTIGRVVFNTAGIYTLIKKFMSSQIEGSVGVASQIWLEGQNRVTDQFSLAAVNSIENSNGWLLASSSATTGQRAIVAMDLRSDDLYGYSYIISKVIHTPNKLKLKSIITKEQLYDVTSSGVFYYRTAATYADPMFNSATGSWVEVPFAGDIDVSLLEYTQIKVGASMVTPAGQAYPSITTPIQVSDISLGLEAPDEISEYWDFSYDASSPLIPTISGFRLKKAYESGVVPALNYKWLDEIYNQLGVYNTVANIGNFSHSPDNVTYTPLSGGPIPNVVGTYVKVTHTTPPGVIIRPALVEA